MWNIKSANITYIKYIYILRDSDNKEYYYLDFSTPYHQAIHFGIHENHLTKAILMDTTMYI